MCMAKTVGVEKKSFSHRLRVYSGAVITIFIICYILRSLGIVRTELQSYLTAAGVCTVIVSFLYMLTTRGKLSGTRRRWLNFFLLLPIIFSVSLLVYYIMLEKLYWIVLAFVAASMFFSLYEFILNLRAIWHGARAYQVDTLFNFIYLYVSVIIAYSLLYYMLQKVSETLFVVAHPTDGLLDFVYLSVITMTTTGFGDVVPKTGLAKILVMSQAIVGYMFLSIIFGLMISWLNSRSRR